MQATVTGAAVAGAINLPDDCRELQSVRIARSGLFSEIPPLPPVRLADATVSGFPVGYVMVGNALQLIGGTGTQSYAITYFQDIPDLATSPMNRNWLIQREPGLYLYGALLEASPYLQDPELALIWVQQYQDILRGMQIEDDRARYGNSPSMMPVRGMP